MQISNIFASRLHFSGLFETVAKTEIWISIFKDYDNNCKLHPVLVLRADATKSSDKAVKPGVES